MKKLVIFTKLFPYAKTEAFLESEIEVLSNLFDEIIICPTFKNKHLRPLPKNVSVNTSFLFEKKTKIRKIFSAFFYGYIFRYFVDHFFKIKSINDLKNIVRYAIYEVHYVKQLKKFSLSDETNTVFYSYWFSQVVNALIKSKQKNKKLIKLVSRAHRWDVYEDQGFFPYRKHSLKHMDCLYSISTDGKKYIEEKYGDIGNIKISRLGVFDNNSISQISEKNKFSILTVSQITSRKRLFLLLESLVLFARNQKDIIIQWTHFGTGDLEQELKSKVELIKQTNLIIDIKGYVLNTKVYDFYKNNPIDVFVNLSTSEGVPVSIMEAQSFGIPVIATDVGGTSEIVSSDVGVLLKSNPSINEVEEALVCVQKTNIERTYIKEKWNMKSNAKKNYTDFAKDIIKL